ncbi:MAG: hypothetical protein JRI25_10075 [Deltaproteobacteria bacterium]|nr:hypothetical protein [Deltaproteobacteria bacterium]
MAFSYPWALCTEQARDEHFEEVRSHPLVGVEHRKQRRGRLEVREGVVERARLVAAVRHPQHLDPVASGDALGCQARARIAAVLDEHHAQVGPAKRRAGGQAPLQHLGRLVTSRDQDQDRRPLRLGHRKRRTGRAAPADCDVEEPVGGHGGLAQQEPEDTHLHGNAGVTPEHRDDVPQPQSPDGREHAQHGDAPQGEEVPEQGGPSSPRKHRVHVEGARVEQHQDRQQGADDDQVQRGEQAGRQDGSIYQSLAGVTAVCFTGSA